MASTPWRVSADALAGTRIGSDARSAAEPRKTAGSPFRSDEGPGSAPHAHAVRSPQASARVCRCALLAALALALAALESLFPLPLPVPGMRLGVANIVTVATAFWLGPVDAVVVLGVRIVLAAMVTGQLATLPFSLAGGSCALLVTLCFVRFSSPERVRSCAMASAAAHNVGQVAVAVALTGTPEIAFYLPVLLGAGMVAGYLTGTIASSVLDRVPRPKRAAARKEHADAPKRDSPLLGH